MPIVVTHETDPRYLGFGAYASGQAQYDRAREQLGLAYSQMQQRQNLAEQQMQAQQAAQQYDAMQNANRLAAEQQFRAQAQNDQQQFQMGMFDREAQVRQKVAQAQHQGKIMLNEHAYALKEQEKNRRLQAIAESNWDEITKRNAVEKVNIGFSMYEVEKAPTIDERMADRVKDFGGYMIIEDDQGRFRYQEKPNPNIGKDEMRVIGGREIPGQITKDGWQPYHPDLLKEPDTSKQEDTQYKRAIESYERARKTALESPLVLNPDGSLNHDRVNELIDQQVQSEQAFLQRQGIGAGAAPPTGLQAPPQQPMIQAAPTPPEHQAAMAEEGWVPRPEGQFGPDQLVPQMFMINHPNYIAPGPGMAFDHQQQVASALNYDMQTLATAYGGKIELIEQGPHKPIIQRIRRDVSLLRRFRNQNPPAQNPHGAYRTPKKAGTGDYLR